MNDFSNLPDNEIGQLATVGIEEIVEEIVDTE